MVPRPVSWVHVLVIAAVSLPLGGTLPDLDSFPTRRSSDLPHGRPTFVRHYEADLARSFRRTWGLGDRKSTRLNSSHITISYAVFCLKKKSDGVGARRRIGVRRVLLRRGLAVADARAPCHD